MVGVNGGLRRPVLAEHDIEGQGEAPAAAAGLKSGDVITRVNGKTVLNARDLARRIASFAPNSTVALTVVHDGNERTVDLKLGEMKDSGTQVAAADSEQGSHALGKLGIEVSPAKQVAGAGEAGLAVMAVDPNGKAAELGIRAGDVILKSAGKTVNSASDLKKSMADAKAAGKKNALVLIKRDKNEIFLTVPVAAG